MVKKLCTFPSVGGVHQTPFPARRSACHLRCISGGEYVIALRSVLPRLYLSIEQEPSPVVCCFTATRHCSSFTCSASPGWGPGGGGWGGSQSHYDETSANIGRRRCVIDSSRLVNIHSHVAEATPTRYEGLPPFHNSRLLHHCPVKARHLPTDCTHHCL